MLIALAIITGLILIGLIYLASLDGKFHARRKREMPVPVDEVFNTVLDLKTWPEWNPWLIHEPGAKIVASDNCNQEGGSYSWDGKVVGAGKLSHVAITPNKSIRQQIEFIRPFKSTNQVNWYFEAKADSTLVEWEMEGSMPFLFRFMAKNIAPMIAKDYDLGLALLQGYLQPDSPHPRLSFRGKETLDDFHYWAIPFNGNLRDLESNRKTSLATLESAAGADVGLGLTIYREIDNQQAHFRAEFAVPVPGTLPECGYPTRQFNGGRYFQIELLGSHEFLPLAWYAAFSHCRMHKIKLDKSRPSLEIYHKKPESVEDSNQVRSILYLPIRS